MERHRKQAADKVIEADPSRAKQAAEKCEISLALEKNVAFKFDMGVLSKFRGI